MCFGSAVRRMIHVKHRRLFHVNHCVSGIMANPIERSSIRIRNVATGCWHLGPFGSRRRRMDRSWPAGRAEVAYWIRIRNESMSIAFRECRRRCDAYFGGLLAGGPVGSGEIVCAGSGFQLAKGLTDAGSR